MICKRHTKKNQRTRNPSFKSMRKASSETRQQDSVLTPSRILVPTISPNHLPHPPMLVPITPRNIPSILHTILLLFNSTRTCLSLPFSPLLMHSPNMLIHLILPGPKAPPLTLTRRHLGPITPLHGAKELDFLGRMAIFPMPAEIGLPTEC